MPAGPVKSVHGAFAIPSLDGIRAIAVMVVFVGHGTFVGEWWPADLGVTIFTRGGKTDAARETAGHGSGSKA